MVEKYSKQMKRSHDLDFDILQDPGNEVANEFGLRFKLPDYLAELYAGFGIDLPRYNGDESWTLPMAGGFVLDKSGVIVRAEFDPDYTRRPEPSETLEFVKNLT